MTRKMTNLKDVAGKSARTAGRATKIASASPRVARKPRPEPKAEPQVSDVEAWLDQLDPDVTLPRDAQHLRMIRSARQGVEDADAKLRAAVSAARKAGDSWALIGMALETTRQAAFQRFGKNCPAE